MESWEGRALWFTGGGRLVGDVINSEEPNRVSPGSPTGQLCDLGKLLTLSEPWLPPVCSRNNDHAHIRLSAVAVTVKPLGR